jgi:hypothetical protein
MNLQIAKRKQAKIKMALQGPSGSGKTMGALLIGYGLCGNWGKIAVIDTENYSASLYAHLGSYTVVNITAPYSPEKYIDAIKLCEQAGMDVIIIDSISHEWEGSGGILEVHGNMLGNSFTNWSKLTPRHNALVQIILQSKAHIIATIRSKQEYVLSERNGKQVPEKVGMKGVTRDGMDYEFTLVFDVDIKHNAIASKDRTGLFMDKPDVKITPQIGQQILEWCNQGEMDEKQVEAFTQRVKACKSVKELIELYNMNPDYQQSHFTAFADHKKMLLSSRENATNNLSQLKQSNNGNGNAKQ